MTDASEVRVLLAAGESDHGSRLEDALRNVAGYEALRVTAVVLALRELQGDFFDALITNTSVQRPNDALKLIDVLLVKRKFNRNIAVIVLSEQQDPAVIKLLARAGISDYILLTDDAGAILPRIEKVLAGTNIGERLVDEATTYLGPAARVLVDKGSKAHLKIPGLEALRREHLPDLFTWIHFTVTPILKDKAAALMARLENTFPARRT
jgi:DNA-binding NarL/FixJ family response regulator